jgi:hypothetical protein
VTVNDTQDRGAGDGDRYGPRAARRSVSPFRDRSGDPLRDNPSGQSFRAAGMSAASTVTSPPTATSRRRPAERGWRVRRRPKVTPLSVTPPSLTFGYAGVGLTIPLGQQIRYVSRLGRRFKHGAGRAAAHERRRGFWSSPGRFGAEGRAPPLCTPGRPAAQRPLDEGRPAPQRRSRTVSSHRNPRGGYLPTDLDHQKRPSLEIHGWWRTLAAYRSQQRPTGQARQGPRS